MTQEDKDLILNLILQRIEDLDDKLSNHMTAENQTIGELKASVDTLTTVWKTTKGVLWFIKVTASVVTAIGLGWAFLHQHFTMGIK